MRPLTATDVLEVWERAWPLSPLDRALALWSAGSGRNDVAAQPIGERERAMLTLRQAMFGPAIEAVATCPSCQETVEIAVDVRDLTGGEASAGEVTARAAGFEVTCRPPSSGEIAAAGELLGREDLAGDIAALRDALARRCVVRARRGGKEVDPHALPSAALDAIDDALADADPSADIRFDLGCPSCGHTWEAPFDAGAYLWAEVDAHARALVSEIHILASSYGWSEAEILRLSPTRRRLYVEVASR